MDGDISNKAFKVKQLISRRENTDALLPHPLHLIIFRDDPVYDLEVAPFFQGLLDLGPYHITVFGVDYLTIRDPFVPGKLTRGVTRQLKASLADGFHGPVLIVFRTIDHAGQVAHKGKELPSVFQQLFLSLNACRLVRIDLYELSGRQLIDETLTPPGNPLIQVEVNRQIFPLACSPDPQQSFIEPRCTGAGEGLKQGPADNLVPADAVDLLRRPVEFEIFEILSILQRLEYCNTAQRILHHGTVTRLSGMKCFFLALPVGYINNHGKKMRGPGKVNDLKKQEAIMSLARCIEKLHLNILERPLLPYLPEYICPPAQVRPEIALCGSLVDDIFPAVTAELEKGIVHIHDDTVFDGGDGCRDRVHGKTLVEKFVRWPVNVHAAQHEEPQRGTIERETPVPM